MNGEWMQWIEVDERGNSRQTAFRHFMPPIPKRKPGAIQAKGKALCGEEAGISQATGNAPICPDCFTAWYLAESAEVNQRQTLALANLGMKTNEFAKWLRDRRGAWGLGHLKGEPNPDNERIAEALLVTMESLPKIVEAAIAQAKAQTQMDLHRLQSAVLAVSGCARDEREARMRRK